jgi:hypothetical protein
MATVFLTGITNRDKVKVSERRPVGSGAVSGPSPDNSGPSGSSIDQISGTGIVVRTSSWVVRSLTAPAAGLTITNNDGVSGNPTFALANDLAALEGLTSTGYAKRTGTDAWSLSSASGILDDIGNTRGTILYRGASGWAALAPGTSGQVLKTNGTGADPSWGTSGGDVAGPSSSTDNAIARFDGTTGKLIQNSAVTVDDDAIVSLSSSTPKIKYTVNGANFEYYLVVQPSTTNAEGRLILAPNGSSSNSCVLLQSSSTVDSVGSEVFGFGGGFAGAVSGSWNFGSFVYASPTSDSRPISFTVSNTSDGRIEAVRILNTGQLDVKRNIASTSTTTGALTVAGGVGVAGAIHSNSLVLSTALAVAYGGTASTALGTSLTNSGGTLNTIQGIRTTDTPTFAGINSTGPVLYTADSNAIIIKSIGRSTDSFSSIQFKNAADTAFTGYLSVDGSGNINLQAGPTFKDVLYFDHGNARLGVKTTSPAADLHVNGSFQTASPSGGSASPWKLGSYSATAPAATGKVRIEINGTPYDLLAAT